MATVFPGQVVRACAASLTSSRPPAGSCFCHIARIPRGHPIRDAVGASLTHRFQLRCPPAQRNWVHVAGTRCRGRRFESASCRLQAARTCTRMSQIAPDARVPELGVLCRARESRVTATSCVFCAHITPKSARARENAALRSVPCCVEKFAAKAPCLNQETCVRENNFAPKTVRFAWRILYILRSCGVQTSARAPDAPRERARKQMPGRLARATFVP
jgi:hypothetical protein